MKTPDSPFATQHPDPLPARWSRPLLVVILGLYLLLGGLYAWQTPLWQVPDEPAHVNYARHVARTGTLPILQMGDYNAAYLEEIKAARFPPHMSVAPIRYESHQPPLYYVLGGGILRLAAPQALVDDPTPEGWARAVHALRLFSLTLGLGTLLAAYRLVRRLFPRLPTLALAATALIAFIPQHLAILAGANNDALAELLLALFLLTLVDDLHGSPRPFRRGLLLGLMLLTKTTTYLPALLALVSYHIFQALTPPQVRWTRQARALLVDLGIGSLLALPFYARNVAVYGWPDFLGLQRHAQVVVGQMTTAEFIAQQGWATYWNRAITWTFRSFWGQFGWMGVLMDARIYRALVYFSLVLLAGALVFVRCGRRDRHERALVGRTTTYVCLGPYQHNALGVLFAAGIGTLISYIGYNLSFLQHQGRYLFTALIPLAVFTVPGVWMLLAPRAARGMAALWGTLAALALVAAVLDMGPITRWDALTLLALAAWFALAARLPRWRPLWLLAPFLALAGLALLALYAFIVPALRLP